MSFVALRHSPDAVDLGLQPEYRGKSNRTAGTDIDTFERSERIRTGRMDREIQQIVGQHMSRTNDDEFIDDNLSTVAEHEKSQ